MVQERARGSAWPDSMRPAPYAATISSAAADHLPSVQVVNVQNEDHPTHDTIARHSNAPIAPVEVATSEDEK
ncbi:unnamed protein product [Notodromas monacha]|uniref:Uncharacterized protein n=1 Tax=Notodromas monacha TaxID=399045 RepID=A0A7R9BFP9_9CRUS|nr:unnamed protein product [Notodromas monacha]CAG0913270.1 unnamed protein product [Notodromas monacha]